MRGSRPRTKVLTSQNWAELSICEPDDTTWFPDQRQEEQAKAICRSCPVMNECGEYAIANDERYGVWGGLTEDDRAEIRAAKRKLHVAR